MQVVLECVVNVSEGRDAKTISALARAAGRGLLDVHSDPHHNRSVFTLVGEVAPRRLAQAAVRLLDIRLHDGVHPRIGVLDVVPFVPLDGATLEDATRARDAFALWVAEELEVPAFVYGSERSLPEVRRGAFETLLPDQGPPVPHRRAGAVAVGARNPLVAWNVYLDGSDVVEARRVAAQVRGVHVRALGLEVGEAVQVSMNLIAPERVGPAQAWDAVASVARVDRAELVGLVPQAVLEATPEDRWAQLDLATHRTIEARVRSAGVVEERGRGR